MFGREKDAQTAEEELRAAIERYYTEAISPQTLEQIDRETSNPDYSTLQGKVVELAVDLIEAQVDKAIPVELIRALALGIVTSTWHAENLRKTEQGFLVTKEQWEQVHPDKPWPAE